MVKPGGRFVMYSKFLLGTLIVITLIFVASLGLKAYKLNNTFQDKTSGFVEVDAATFNNALYKKAFEIDKDLGKMLIKKILLVNCDKCEKYLEVKQFKSNFYKTLEDNLNYYTNKYTQLDNCKRWYYTISTGDNANIGYGFCKDFLKGYKARNGNVFHDYATIEDVKTIYFWNNIGTGGQQVVNELLQNYCNGAQITVKTIQDNKKSKIMDILCKNTNLQPSLENLQDTRKIELFLYLYPQDIENKLIFKGYNNILKQNRIKAIFKDTKRIKRQIEKIKKDNVDKMLQTNCFKGSILPTLATATFSGGYDKGNYDILTDYATTNTRLLLCITTYLDKNTLLFTKKFSSILVNHNNPYNVVLYNHVLSNIIDIYQDQKELFKNKRK